jgi:glucose-1-phosphate thymidylyltransferase
MKGVLLAGGRGTRLRPLTDVTNKHLLPVYRKPMILYPLETLVRAGIRDVLIVTGGEHAGDFFRLLGSGRRHGARLSYEMQDGSDGTGAALLLAEPFVGGDDFLCVLGDNVLAGDLRSFVADFRARRERYPAKVLLAKVPDPENYGVVAFRRRAIARVVEKPRRPPSRYVSTGLWMFTPDVFPRLRRLAPSVRGEIEVTGVLDAYAREGKLGHAILRSAWTDAGTFDSLYRATVLMRRLERRAAGEPGHRRREA